jgi:hypothetical protein
MMQRNSLASNFEAQKCFASWLISIILKFEVFY